MLGHSPPAPSPIPPRTPPATYAFSNFPKRTTSIRAGDRATPRHLVRNHTQSPGSSISHLDSAFSQGNNESQGGECLGSPAIDRQSTPRPATALAEGTSRARQHSQDERTKGEATQLGGISDTYEDDDQSSRTSTSTLASGRASSSRSQRFVASFTSSSRNKRSADGKGIDKRKHTSRLGFSHTTTDPKHVAMGLGSDQDLPRPFAVTRQIQMNSGSSFSRSESMSSASLNTAQSGVSARTVTSSNISASGETASGPRRKAFVQRNGRTYLNDSSLAYPLPIDLTELHRQSLRTLLLIQAHGGPVRSPTLLKNPPRKVLEVGCGTGFWSMMCHRFFKSRGHSGIHFTGVDLAPVAPGSANISLDSMKPDKDMNWTFVQHDLRHMPWPFEDGEFDLVFSKDMATAIPLQEHPFFSSEILRVLKSGGVFEIWETDYTIRMLRPHVPNTGLKGQDVENQEAASSMGSYMVHLNTPLSAPLNTFLVEYNNWVSKAFEARGLWPTPGTMMSAYILAEIDILVGMGVHRVAVPFSEVRWEREGVGGVVTKDGKSYVEMRGDRPPHQKVEKKTLTSAQSALRRTALLTFVEEIQALEPNLREVSGKSQDEWDIWMGKMMTDLMTEGGTSWGECLESGAWWATKR